MAYGEAEPEADFRAVFDAAPTPYLLLTPDLTIVHANQARLRVTGTTLADNVGRHLFEAFPDNPEDPSSDGTTQLRESLERVKQTGRPHSMPIQRYDLQGPDGEFELRYWSPRNSPVLDEKGRVVLLLHAAEDVTDYVRDRAQADHEAAEGRRWKARVDEVEADLFHRAQELAASNKRLLQVTERAQRNARALAGLAETVSALAAAERVPDLLELLFRAGATALGTAAMAVALRDPDVPVVVVHTSGGRTYRLPLDAEDPMAAGARGHRVTGTDRSGERPETWVVLPLRDRARLVGAIAVRWHLDRSEDTARQRVLDALAGQLGQAIPRVHRLQEERARAGETRNLAEALQRSLLTDPPAFDGLTLEVRYRPAAEVAQVGGDWYDAFRSAEGAATIVIGDVTGHDRDAAAAMGQLRNLLRGVAHSQRGRPDRSLAALDRAMRDLEVRTLATALVGCVEPCDGPDGGATLHWSSAGHLPPLLLPPTGPAELLAHRGDLLLGLEPDSPRQCHEAALPAGATLLLYTDGLVERRGESLDAGLARLREIAALLRGRALPDLCDALLSDLTPEASDDVVLLALQVDGSPSR